MTINNYRENIYNPILNETVKGFLSNSLESYKNNFDIIEIPLGMEYRPDLIAAKYLNDSSLSWIITYINNFTNGVKEYTHGRKIKIPSSN